jgi:hypothetical protein
MAIGDYFIMLEAIASSAIEGITLTEEEQKKLLMEALMK